MNAPTGKNIPSDRTPHERTRINVKSNVVSAAEFDVPNVMTNPIVASLRGDTNSTAGWQDSTKEFAVNLPSLQI